MGRYVHRRTGQSKKAVKNITFLTANSLPTTVYRLLFHAAEGALSRLWLPIW
jgi:hypothetical protein